MNKRIAILGGGPSGLFVFKRLVESGHSNFGVDIFESKNQLGAGMPYSVEGANREHVTNVSDNEIPTIVTSIEEWVKTLPAEILEKFNIDKDKFNEYKVFPRLLFGQYLSDQFSLLLDKAKESGIVAKVHFNSSVTDIKDNVETKQVTVEIGGKEIFNFDQVVICTGHKWPVKHEGKVSGYFDSPYPPSKLELKLNHPIAIKGSSLTAIDAIRTLARANGTFQSNVNGKVSFTPFKDSDKFKIVLHSRNGLLPAIRFHLAEPLLSTEALVDNEHLAKHISENNGFLSLDYLFEKDFKDMFKEKDPGFYDYIKDMTVEDFVEAMMSLREHTEPFELFKEEYAEAEKSIRKKESIYWKEMLAVLSFAMNYPAKYLSAEDMQRLQKVLMPLISIVIAFAPQSSCEELMALHDAGKLDIISVGEDSTVEPESQGGVCYHYTDEENKSHSDYYSTFVDCVGQPHLDYKEFPFKSLLDDESVSPAKIQFRSSLKGEKALADGNKKVEKGADRNYYLNVSGITINDSFQIVNKVGEANDKIHIMAVPYIGGYNPDYSGLDFCEQASETIVGSILGTGNIQKIEDSLMVSSSKL